MASLEFKLCVERSSAGSVDAEHKPSVVPPFLCLLWLAERMMLCTQTVFASDPK